MFSGNKMLKQPICWLLIRFNREEQEEEDREFKVSERCDDCGGMLWLSSPSALWSLAPNWKVISVSGSTFPTSLVPLCPDSLSPLIRLTQQGKVIRRVISHVN